MLQNKPDTAAKTSIGTGAKSRSGYFTLLRTLIRKGPPTNVASWTVGSLLLSLTAAVVIVALAVLVRITILAALGTRLVYITLYPAVVAASVIGGLPAGILAAVLSATIASFWLAPIFENMEYLGLGVFLLACALIVSVVEAMHRARARVRDAEARAQISDAIRESQAQLSAVVNNAAEGITVTDDRGRIRSTNSTMSKIFGYASDELVGQSVGVLMNGRQRLEHDAYIGEYLNTGRAKIIGIGREVEARRKDGTLFPAHLAVSEIVIEGKRHFVGHIRDISEQKQAQENQARLTEQLSRSEQQARQQEALFKGVFDGAPDAIVLTDMNRRIRMVNPALQSLFGFSESELEGAPDLRIYASQDDWRRVSELMSAQSERGLTTRENVSFRKKNKTTFPGEILAGYYRDVTGTPLGYITIIRDMSEEIARQEAKRQSQKLESLGQLTGGIAHDFNNILTTIIGNHEYLKERLTESDEQHALRRANDAAEMAARLTTRLLTFARRRQLEPVSLNLNIVISTISELLRRTIGESISLELLLAKELDYVRADVSEIENVIINLALNSRDAMPNGGRLTIETGNLKFTERDAPPGLAPGPYVVLSVTDTGVGMTQEVMTRAFEPFFSTKGIGRGTGLGLSTVYGFAEQSGGRVVFDSTFGKGTTVRVLLPPCKKPLNEIADDDDMPLAPNAEIVLVVEDDPDVRETTLRRVEALGYVAVEAHNSASAIQILQTGDPIDLVFSDVVMPGGMSGYELASWVTINRPDVKILLTSGHVDISHVDPAAREQFELLEKPYKRAELAQALFAKLTKRE